MRVLCATAFSKVLDLHDFGKHGHIHRRFCRLGVVPFLKDFLVLDLRELFNELEGHIERRKTEPGGRHPCASISAGTSVDPWTCPLSISPPSLDPPAVVLPRASPFVSQSPPTPPAAELQPPCPSLSVRAPSTAMHRILHPDLIHPCRRHREQFPPFPLTVE